VQAARRLPAGSERLAVNKGLRLGGYGQRAGRSTEGRRAKAVRNEFLSGKLSSLAGVGGADHRGGKAKTKKMLRQPKSKHFSTDEPIYIWERIVNSPPILKAHDFYSTVAHFVARFVLLREGPMALPIRMQARFLADSSAIFTRFPPDVCRTPYC